MVMLKNPLAVQRKPWCSFPATPKPGLSPTHVQSISACPGCCWGQTQVNRVYIANLVRKWFGHLSLMPNGCSYSLCEWGEFHWAILSELQTWFCSRTEQLEQKDQGPSSVQDSCSHRGAVLLPVLALLCKSPAAPQFIASQREKHPRNPATYCGQRSLPPKHLRIVPCAVFVCHMSQEIREKAAYNDWIIQN